MKKEVEYALVTSSALPSEIQASEHYISLDKPQWLDLGDYSADLVNSDENQEILFLIVAKGTSEQQAEDDARRAQKKKAFLDLESGKEELNDQVAQLNAQIHILEKELDERVDIQAKHDLLAQQLDEILGKKGQLRDELDKMKEADKLEEEREAQRLQAEVSRQKELRSKSVNIFNALYNK